MLSDSGKSTEAPANIKDVTRKISPGLVVYSVTIVDRALKGLPIPLVIEKMLVFTRVGNNFPLAK